MDTKLSKQSENDHFDRLAQEFFDGWLRYHPEAAAHAGPDALHMVEDDDRNAFLSWLESLVFGLQEINTAALDRVRQTEHYLLAQYARIEHMQLLANDWRATDPVSYVERLEIALHAGLWSELENPDRLTLEAIPEFLRYAHFRLKNRDAIPQIWCDAAMRRLEVLSERLKPVRSTYGDLLSEVILAVGNFHAFLSSIATTDSFDALASAQRYGDILKHRFLVDPELPVVQGLLDGMIGETSQQMTQALEALGDSTVPAPENAVEGQCWMQRCCETSQAFIRERQLFDIDTVPAVAMTLKISGSPVTHAAYELAMDADEQARLLIVERQDTPQARLANDCIRYGWPGEYLARAVHAQAGPCQRHVRKYLADTAFYDAWRLYAEQVMVEQGYEDNGNRRYNMLAAQVEALRAAKADLMLHSGALNLSGVQTFLQTGPGITSDEAGQILLSLSRFPGRAVATVWWWLLLRHLARQCVELEGRFDYIEFHRQVLESGAVPLPLLIVEAFGTACYSNVEKGVLE